MQIDWEGACCRPRLLPDGHTRWRVWAPYAQQVELVLIDGQRQRGMPMAAHGEGYFEHDAADIPAGQRYAYRLGNGPMRPDPCSLWQPDGVHRPSAVIYPEHFHWTDQHWRGIQRQDLVFYELHVGTFTPEGTFEAVIPRLPQLRELGITALEIMPVAEFPGRRNWGYDGVHLFAPQSTYGGPDGLHRLVNAAHEAGLAVFLDVVYNHFGPEGNYVGEFGPYYSNRYRTPWGQAFNFDGRGCDPVRDFVLDNVRYWFDAYHLDGMRLDAVHAMFDISPVHILQEIKQTADAAAARHGWPAHIVVESLLNDPRMVMPPERGGYGCDAEWNEDFHHALIAYLTGDRHGKYVDFGPVEHLQKVMQDTFLLSGVYSRYRGRRWGKAVGDLPGDRFVIGVQNHDHVGNRALGERIASLASPAAQRLAVCFVMFAPHLPLIFMGEEYGEENPFLFFCSFEDRQTIENVRQGRRSDYALIGEIPDPQDPSSFEASRLSWSWPEGSHRAGLRRLYRDLLEFRRTWPALREWKAREAKLWPNQGAGRVLEVVRGGRQSAEGKTVCIYFNLTSEPHPLLETIPSDQSLLFRSESPQYKRFGEPAGNDPKVLLPFECMAFGEQARGERQ